MKVLRDTLKDARLNERSIPAIEIATYLRLWKEKTFFSKEWESKRKDEFIPVTAGKFLEQQFCLAAALLERGISRGDYVAVYSRNSLRYAIAFYAILSLGAVFVPIYPTVSREILDYILYHSEAKCIYTGDYVQYEQSHAFLSKPQSPLSTIITNSDHVSDSRVASFDEIMERDPDPDRFDAVIRRIQDLTEDDLAAVLYTLTADGIPKGVMLTHGNFIAQKAVAAYVPMDDRDIKLAHLPFSHVFGLSVDLFGSAVTGSVTAICSSLETEEIINDILAVRPTIMSSVPRMYEKMYVQIKQGIERYGWLKKKLYHSALETATACFIQRSRRLPIPFKVRFLKSVYGIVCRRIQASLGLDRIRYLFSGGSSLPLDVAYFFGALGIPIIEGYGLTETSPIVNMNIPERNKPGTVGPPIPGVEERISGEGEILVKGPVVFKGYLKMTEETAAEIFTEDGFFRTGDVGSFDDEGNLVITGRLKDLIITSTGKNIAPRMIEKQFEQEVIIEHICVVGDQRKYLTALIVPNTQYLMGYARKHNIDFDRIDDLIEKREIVELYKSCIDRISQSSARFEQIKKFTLLSRPFSINTGELTLARKFNRALIQEKYKEVIDRMYPSSELI